MRELNSREAIIRASDKLLTLQALQREGISVPPFGTTRNALDSCGYETIVCRTRRGSAGRGISFAQLGELPYAELYTAYIPTTREYRVHVFNGRTIRTQGKYNDFPERAGDGRIRNHDHGFRFRTPRQRLHSRRTDACIEAVRTLGLLFGAVDIVIGEDGNHYILEVNTAPALSPMTLEAYRASFASYLAERNYIC
jgi:glutathione synthase/RimK-type ligase-like ATP-grasp enzyme